MDRNDKGVYIVTSFKQSLSARRAWIEISHVCVTCRVAVVALRKESVDRNNAVQIVIVKMYASLSARRAWIEIRIGKKIENALSSRSPQGERG